MPVNGLHLNQLCHLERISVSGTSSNYHSFVVAEAAEAIANSPLLAHLEINYTRGSAPRPPLDRFLAKQSPEMRLSFSHVAIADMGDYCRVEPHLHALQSLELVSLADDCPESLMESRTLMAKIYNTLAHERILLSRIVIDDVFPAFLDYLSLYSGILTEIRILYLYKPVPWKELDELAVRFYASILPKHVDSLEIINISPMFTCKWCFHPREYSVFSQAKNLRSLNVSFAFTHLDPNPDYTLDNTVRDPYLACEISR